MMKHAFKIALASVFFHAATPQDADAQMSASIYMQCHHGSYDQTVGYSVTYNLDAERTVSFGFTYDNFDIFMRPIMELGEAAFDNVNMPYTSGIINTGDIEIPVRVYFSNITNYVGVRIKEEDYQTTFTQNEMTGLSPSGWLCERRNNHNWRGL